MIAGGRFEIGDTVRLSSRGIGQGLSLKGGFATVIGSSSRDPSLVAIRVDGTTYRQLYHESFLVLVAVNDPSALPGEAK